MLLWVNDHLEQASSEPYVASSAVLAGDVRLGPGCVIDHGAVLTASDAPIELGSGVVVLPGAVIRSTGGADRPAHAVVIGDDCLIGPHATLTGCRLDEAVYVATQAMIFHGARVGAGSRLSAGCIVHTRAQLPAGSRVGIRHFAVAAPDDRPAIVTADVPTARRFIAEADFFGTAFAVETDEQADLGMLHRRTTRSVAGEIRRRRERPRSP